MKHANGTEFVLCPTAADMTDDQAEAIALGIGVCGGMAYDAYRLALSAAPAYEPSDEDVERSARALAADRYGDIAWEIMNNKQKRPFLRKARAAIRAFIGGK